MERMALSTLQFGGYIVTEGKLSVTVSEQHRLPDTVAERAKDIRDERDFPSVGEAVRHVFQEAGHDV